jgi:hypothetical protein
MKKQVKNLSYANLCVKRASESNLAAKDARFHRQKRDNINEILEGWQSIMASSPVGLFMVIWTIACVAELLTSWEMYRELLTSISSNPHWTLSLIMGLFVIGLGAFVSHYLSKYFSRNLRELDVFNATSSNELRLLAEESVKKNIKNDFLIGIVAMVILLLIVGFISWQRIFLQSEVSGSDYSIFQKVLPIIIVVVEVFSGIFLFYFLLLNRYKQRSWKHHKKYNSYRQKCVQQNQMAINLYYQAVDLGEEIAYNNDLRDALWRYEHRSSGSDNYVDSIPPAQTTKIIVLRDGKSESGVHLYGKLPNGETTSAVFTSSFGHATLIWEGSCQVLESVFVNSQEHIGPFQANSTVNIEMDSANHLRLGFDNQQPSNQK